MSYRSGSSHYLYYLAETSQCSLVTNTRTIIDLYYTLLHVKMDENHKKIIDKHMVALVNQMDIFNIAINLQSKHLFSDHEVDTIMVIFLFLSLTAIMLS